MKILLVEDEIDLANSISEYLVKSEKFTCDVAFDYAKGSELAELYEYDCLIVDIGLPDGSGLDLIREVKEKENKSGIIIISARDALDDRIEGLNIGADDYLVKPFHLSELNARIYSLMRRLKFDGDSNLEVNEISINLQTRDARVNNKVLDLTKNEYDLLMYMITNRNKVISKTSIAEHLSGEYVDVLSSFDFIYAHIKNLRKKLIDAGCEDYIKTVYGVGYKFLTE
jgi:DNA-binding response OmpR family regulator